MGDDYTIADIAIFPWVRVLDGFYGAGEMLGLADFGNVNAWAARCEARPTSKIGLNMPPRG
jgi:GSH-dependent disulfide-bond oxidoreductase